MINYPEIFKNSLDKLKSEGNYRIFADLEKLAGNFPQALNYTKTIQYQKLLYGAATIIWE